MSARIRTPDSPTAEGSDRFRIRHEVTRVGSYWLVQRWFEGQGWCDFYCSFRTRRDARLFLNEYRGTLTKPRPDPGLRWVVAEVRAKP